MVETQDWEERVIALKAEDESRTSADIAEIVGKHAGTVRKVLKRHREAEEHAIRADIERIAEQEGQYVWSQPTGNGNVPHEAIPGQTTVDDFTVPAEDDPEHDLDPLDQFRSEAGDPVGPMIPAPLPEPGESESRLRGTRQMALDFGENADVPVGGTIVIRSDKLASGFYGLGDVITGTFTARVVDVAGKERLQRASDEFRAQPQAHVALITELSLG